MVSGQRSRISKPEVGLAVALLALTASVALAQYSVDWHTIDGGVTGTGGQPDSGKLSGGQFTLVGGFWDIVAGIETSGAPLLSVSRTDLNTVAIA